MQWDKSKQLLKVLLSFEADLFTQILCPLLIFSFGHITLTLSVPSDRVCVCVFQGDRGRDGTSGLPGVQGPPVSNCDLT